MSNTQAQQLADPMAEIEAAIADMRQARDIHEGWACYFEQNPDDPDSKAVGDAAWHRGWVGRYDRVLAILKALRQTHQDTDGFLFSWRRLQTNHFEPAYNPPQGKPFGLKEPKPEGLSP